MLNREFRNARRTVVSKIEILHRARNLGELRHLIRGSELTRVPFSYGPYPLYYNFTWSSVTEIRMR